MTLLAHLVRADVRRHRWLLAAWLAVVTAGAVLLAVKPMLDADGSLQAVLELLVGLLSIMQILLGMLLAVLVVQSHPLVGSTAFWMTRPIRPEILLASKAALLLAVMVVVPVVAQLVVMAAYHVPSGQMAGVAVQLSLVSSLWVVLIAVLAAITSSLARFALLVGGLLAAMVLGLAITTALLLARSDEGMNVVSTGIGDPTADLVGMILVLASGALVLLTQYRTRSRARSIAVGAIGITVASLAAWAWPWPVLRLHVEPPRWVMSASRPQLVAGDGRTTVLEQLSGTSTRMWRATRAPLILQGVEPGWTMRARLLESRLSVAGRGELVTSQGDAAVIFADNSLPFDDRRDNPSRQAARQVLGVGRVADGNSPRGETALVMNVLEPEYRRFAPATGHYRGRFEITPTVHEIEGVLPLRVGAAHQHGAHRVVVAKITSASGSATVEVRRSWAWSMFDRALRPWHRYFLRNRSEASAVEGSEHERVPHWGLPITFGTESGFGAQRLHLAFPPRYAPTNGDHVAVDAGWLAGAELVIVRTLEAGAFERRIEIEQLMLGLPEKGREE